MTILKKELPSERYSHRVSLYNFVYTRQLSCVVVALLFSSFLLQPFHRALADTESVSSELGTMEVSEALDLDTESNLAPVMVEIPISLPDSDDEHVVLPEDNEVPANAADVGIRVEAEGEDVPGTLESSSEGGIDSAKSDSEELSAKGIVSEQRNSSEDSTASGGDSDTDVLSPVGSNPEAIVELAMGNLVSATSASTTANELLPLSEPAALPLVHNSYSDEEVRFSKDNCVQVDGGAYYCQTKGTLGMAGDAVISEPDSGGDLEIYVVKNGVYHQITHNFLDDAAPFYDGRSKTIVWHRLLNDRYVIVSYDLESGKETLITNGEYNDMEPTRFGDSIVWQRWSEGFWQIMLASGEDVRQLTSVANHHVAPQIRNDLILWHTTSPEGEKQLQTYDLQAGLLHTIDDAEGAAMSNPRMMMVYEAVYENGDVVTRGVDLKTGKIIALGLVPSSIPTELPDSESTGETRALIQNKSQEHEGESVNDEPDPEPLTPNVATSTDGLTIDLRAGVEIGAVVASEAENTDFDLYIPAASSTQNAFEI